MAQLRNTTISDTGSIALPVGTTAQRPASPAAGQIRYNTDINDTEYYDGGDWKPISDSNPEATGGTVVDTDIGGVPYRIHLFTNTGNSTFTVSRGGEVEYLIVAGGGGGGAGRASASWWSGGGGGAGGLISSSLIAERTTNYTITVGAGGLGQVAGTDHQTSTGVNGSNSSAFGQTAVGGGAGASYISPSGNLTGRSGGSGGGGAGGSGIGGTATVGQGNIGGGGVGGGTPGGGASGGGGGAGSPGIDGIDGQSGAGGQGLANSITGSTVYYAGGGGGGGPNASGFVVAPGTGGAGGGGAGSSTITGTGNSGTANTGGGGGGMGGANFINNIGGAGGSGIVVIRYRRNATTTTSPNETRPSFQPFFYARDVRPIIARDGLVLDLDAANPLSYPGTGTTWTDLSGNGNNGTLVNSVPFQLSRDPYGSLFTNGVDSYARFILPQTVQSRTISVWFFTDTVIAQDADQNPPGVGYQMANFGTNGTLASFDGITKGSWTGGATNETLGYYQHTPARFIHMRDVVSVGWHNFVMRYNDIAGIYNFFLDGTQRDVFVATQGNPGLLSTDRVIVGAPGDPATVGTPGADYYGRHNFSQILLYNRSLSDQEIQQNFNATRGRYGY